MPRYNIFIPDYLKEQWEELENRSQWVQDKLEEDYQAQKKQEKLKQVKVASDA